MISLRYLGGHSPTRFQSSTATQSVKMDEKLQLFNALSEKYPNPISKSPTLGSFDSINHPSLLSSISMTSISKQLVPLKFQLCFNFLSIRVSSYLVADWDTLCFWCTVSGDASMILFPTLLSRF
ncbi:hypothetical protein Dimus_013810 [Dionaea muscipula]